MALFDGTSTPELNQATLDKLLKRLEEERQLRVSQARGMAVNQGLGLGSTIEGQQIGYANSIASNAGNDAAVNISTAAAEAARQDRLTREGQVYNSAESEKNRQAQLAEAERQRIFQANQEALGRTFSGEQNALNRDAEMAAARRSGRDSLLGSGLGAAGSVVGGLFRQGSGGLFGRGAPAAAGIGGANATTTGISGSMGLPAGGVGTPGLFGGVSALPIAGAAALNIGAMGLGQKLGSQIGGYSRGANIGSKVGGLFGGPVGALTGGVVGGAAKKVKKLFCFDPTTMIEMADGSAKPISQIELGDETKGGIVLSIRRSLTEEGTRFYYKGVIVTGSHAVLEGKRWTRIEQSEWAQPLEGSGIVISLVTDMHRIFIKGLEFADEQEIEGHDEVNFEQSLEILNAEQEEING